MNTLSCLGGLFPPATKNRTYLHMIYNFLHIQSGLYTHWSPEHKLSETKVNITTNTILWEAHACHMHT